jgi:hypothetical protein
VPVSEEELQITFVPPHVKGKKDKLKVYIKFILISSRNGLRAQTPSSNLANIQAQGKVNLKYEDEVSIS